MSSPIALGTKNRIKDFFVRIHQALSHRHRVDILARKISALIREELPGNKRIGCLDVGCGDMGIAEAIAEFDARIEWKCIDVHALPECLSRDEKWKKYQQFDGNRIPFDDGAFDVVLFCDVLHHADENAVSLLVEAARVGSFVIVKDHFEYSLFSRFMLKVLDFLGNWGYGINLPRRYFTMKGFGSLSRSAGLVIKRIDIGIDLYAHLPVIRWFSRPKWQFLAVLEKDIS